MNYVEIHKKIISPKSQLSTQNKSNKTITLPIVREIRIESVERKRDKMFSRLEKLEV